ncbi:IS4 family transposase [Kribbella caucasensis]|uniref:IS4 family transposase n=1 Tax=Kribbella caucasensis TaxID=2512215 RepID=UPI0010610074|nr:IS4 family transposase [Kribbella sp. VKM Ac-2527]
MARVGQVKSRSGDRLTDRVGIGVLTRSFPPGLVDEVVSGLGRTEKRSRLLPARLVVYYVMALALFASDSYEEVMRRLVQGLAWTARWRGTWRVPSSPAISKARARLGPGVLAALFDRACVPVATPDTPGAFCRSWRLVAVDGTTFDVPDEPGNVARFAKPSNDQGQGAFPQVRLVALAECGTHAVFASAMDSISTGEQDLFGRLLPKIGPGMLVIADRNFLGHDLWVAAAATGADLLWRAKSDTRLPVVTELADGSYLSYLVQPGTRRRGKRIPVRVVEYTLQASESEHPHKAGEVYRLVTTILDPDAAPAEDLAAAYAQRWEIESVFDEIKTHQLDARPVLRSRDPDGVEQEIWGILLLHHAIRDLIHTSAVDAGLDPDQVSFTRALRAARRQVSDQAALSPLPPAPRRARRHR